MKRNIELVCGPNVAADCSGLLSSLEVQLIDRPNVDDDELVQRIIDTSNS